MFQYRRDGLGTVRRQIRIDPQPLQKLYHDFLIYYIVLCYQHSQMGRR
jgi:hypothetical protein